MCEKAVNQERVLQIGVQVRLEREKAVNDRAERHREWLKQLVAEVINDYERKAKTTLNPYCCITRKSLDSDERDALFSVGFAAEWKRGKGKWLIYPNDWMKSRIEQGAEATDK